MASTRSVLITGCSDGGMGASLALAFHKKGGFHVVATARNPTKMTSLQSAGIDVLTLDVGSEKSIAQCAQQASELLDNKLDMLINNAGMGYSMPLMDVQLDKMRTVFEANVFSLVSVTQGFLPLLRASANPVVVNHTSVASLLNFSPPMQSVYNSSKAAAGAITHNMRQELAAFGIRVVELKTGGVSTNFFANVPDAGADKLPSDSIYTLGKEKIDLALNGVPLMDDAIPSDEWARLVVVDLVKPTPPNCIWRGDKATLLSYLAWLPAWVFDNTMKGLMGVKEFEKRYRAQNAGLKKA